MKITEIAFTVVPVTDLNISRRFYEDILGLTASSIWEKDGKGMIEYEIGGGTFAIGSGAPLLKPSADGGAVAFEVEDFQAAIDRFKEHNLSFKLESYETPVCHMAMVTDPDGNFIMIHHRKAQ